MKREKYLSWDCYFMGVAFLSALRSKDPSTINGACIVDSDKHIIATGYNGFPMGCSDDIFPWVRDAENDYETKYPYVIHAETNAIHNSDKSLKGTTLYLYSEKGYYPCSECAKNIAQVGIKKVIMSFAINKDTDKYVWVATKKIFNAKKIQIKILNKKDVITNFLHMNSEILGFVNKLKGE